MQNSCNLVLHLAVRVVFPEGILYENSANMSRLLVLNSSAGLIEHLEPEVSFPHCEFGLHHVR